jgi:hypothetical protein
VGIFTIAILIFIGGIVAAAWTVRFVLTRAMQARMGGKEAYKQAYRAYDDQLAGQPGHDHHGQHGGGFFGGGHGGSHHGGGFFGGGHHGGGGGGGDGGGGGGHHH